MTNCCSSCWPSQAAVGSVSSFPKMVGGGKSRNLLPSRLELQPPAVGYWMAFWRTRHLLGGVFAIRSGLCPGKWLGVADGELVKAEAIRSLPRILPGTNKHQVNGRLAPIPHSLRDLCGSPFSRALFPATQAQVQSGVIRTAATQKKGIRHVSAGTAPA